MNIYQEVFNALHAEAQGILEAADYRSNTLTLRVNYVPGEGWSYECLAAPAGSGIRKQLIRPGEAPTPTKFLDLLRERVATSSLQQAA